MIAKLVPIGNSRGIRLPKAVIDQCGFENAVELKVLRGGVELRPLRAHPRAGWADAFKAMAAAGDDRPVHGAAPTATRFDEEEWKW